LKVLALCHVYVFVHILVKNVICILTKEKYSEVLF
jgi:hypothetical protein